MSYLDELPTNQLQVACKLTRAKWAIWLSHLEGYWKPGLDYGLSKLRLKTLLKTLHQDKVRIWLAGSLASGRLRWRDSGPDTSGLGSQRLYLFPHPASHQILMVAADELDRLEEGIFRLLALNPPSISATRPAGIQGLTRDNWLPPYEIEASYDPQVAFESILVYLAGKIHCDAAYLGIRSGDYFYVQATWNCLPGLLGFAIPIRGNEVLSNLVVEQSGIVLDQTQLERLPHLPVVTQAPPKKWMWIPVVISQQVIGLVAFATHTSGVFNKKALAEAVQQVHPLAFNIENAIAFAEATKYLGQLVLLNELASTATTGDDIDEVTRRVMQRLRRSFNTDWAALFLLSADGETLREFGGKTDSGSAWTLPVESSFVGLAVQSGMPVYINDFSSDTRVKSPAPELRSALTVPLKYRGEVIGALALLSNELNAFTTPDKQLLVLIASHLAGMFENLRLNRETFDRAQKLQDTVRQLQAVRETALDITADLDTNTLLQRIVQRARDLAGARGAELGLVESRLTPGEEACVRVVVSDTPWEIIPGEKIPLLAGIAGRMAVFGEPMIVNDYNKWQGRLQPEKQSPYQAVAGVPLRLKDKVIGTLTVLDDRPEKTFQEEDVRILELLAPQAAISIRNARLYQELQEHIQAQHLAEDQLVRSTRLAAVGEMAAGIVHELNNPLTAIIGFIELALNDLLAEAPQRPDLNLALEEALRARSVVRRMLDLAQQPEQQWVLCDLNEIVSQALTLVNYLVRTHNVMLQLELWDELPLIRVDPNQINQVLLNLLYNALYAMPGGGTLTVRTRLGNQEDSKSAEWLVVEIEDTGKGIPVENLERIFEPSFTMLDRGSLPVKESSPLGENDLRTGLGLSVSQEIITSHGGSISVDSEVGKGSRFTIFLPVLQTASPFSNPEVQVEPE